MRQNTKFFLLFSTGKHIYLLQTRQNSLPHNAAIVPNVFLASRFTYCTHTYVYIMVQGVPIPIKSVRIAALRHRVNYTRGSRVRKTRQKLRYQCRYTLHNIAYYRMMKFKCHLLIVCTYTIVSEPFLFPITSYCSQTNSGLRNVKAGGNNFHTAFEYENYDVHNACTREELFSDFVGNHRDDKIPILTIQSAEFSISSEAGVVRLEVFTFPNKISYLRRLRTALVTYRGSKGVEGKK